MRAIAEEEERLKYRQRSQENNTLAPSKDLPGQEEEPNWRKSYFELVFMAEKARLDRELERQKLSAYEEAEPSPMLSFFSLSFF